LLTRKAVRVLSEVDWIFYPAETRTGASFARRIIAPLALPEGKFRQVSLGMSQDRSTDQQAYATAVEAMAAELYHGRSVAWMTQGDPLFYSTFIHLYQDMRRRFPDVPVDIVSGVTSPSAAAAAAGLPLSLLAEKVAILPAVYGLTALPFLLENFATVCLMKVNTVFDQLLEILAGLSYPVQTVYVEKVGTPESRVVTDLRTLQGQKLSYFSLVILRQNTHAATPASAGETL
jgi:precorrin-2/cobalt-factor-2 C20-methyltransferase